MQLAKIRYGTWDETVAMIENGVVAPLVMSDQYQTLADLLEAEDVRQAVESLRRRSERLPLASVTILAPIDRQEARRRKNERTDGVER